MEPHRTQLTMLEAPNPWGPWSIFYRNDDSPSAPGMYGTTFPSRYILDPVGKSAQLLLIFSCLQGGSAQSCRYNLNWQAITLTLA